MWYYKCRKCGTEYEENENLSMVSNPSGIAQKACPKCRGALDDNFRRKKKMKRKSLFGVFGILTMLLWVPLVVYKSPLLLGLDIFFGVLMLLSVIYIDDKDYSKRYR